MLPELGQPQQNFDYPFCATWHAATPRPASVLVPDEPTHDLDIDTLKPLRLRATLKVARI